MTESNHTPQQQLFKVLLIGDSCIDEYKIGTVDRLSPEAPVPIIKIVNEYSVKGMAANVYENLSKFGLDIDFVTNVERIVKTRYIDERSRQHLLRVDCEPKISQWDGRLAANLGAYDAIVISDYNKGFLTYEQIEGLIHESSVPVFIDTKKPDLSRFAGAYLKINELEFRSRTSISDKTIVTLGNRGALYMGADGDDYFPARAVEVVDVCGCGDTFLSALTYEFLRSSNIKTAIKFANTAASITVQHRGNYAPSLTEIQNA
jgi:bifunctional ADP-heptose synthase (sugar kinase/adenylyltransferase)